MRSSVLLFWLCWLPAVGATSYGPYPWQARVSDADFVGVVECTRAGGIVARFKVIESWKGLPAGRELGFEQWYERYSRYPIALVGERYLVRANRGTSSEVWEADLRHDESIPLWWRRLPYQYRLGRGRVRLPLRPWTQEEPSLGAFGADEFRTLARFKQAVERWLALKPEAREFALLRIWADVELFRPFRVEKTEMGRELAALQKQWKDLTDTRSLVLALLELARLAAEEHATHVKTALAAGGGHQTLKILQGWLKELPAARRQELEEWGLVRAVEDLQYKLGLKKYAPEKRPPAAGAPTRRELEAARKALTPPVNEHGKSFALAFGLLTRHDPAPLADYLARRKPKERRDRKLRPLFDLVSRFVWRCGKDRKRLLTRLLGAREPIVRAAAAVYLCFEDLEAGERALRKLAELPGDAGTWAALTLARRGDRSVVPRALLATRGQRQGGSLGDRLRKRILVLLSNSARASGLPQPGRENLEAWWKRHGAKVTLRDPWLELLARQRVD